VGPGATQLGLRRLLSDPRFEDLRRSWSQYWPSSYTRRPRPAVPRATCPANLLGGASVTDPGGRDL